MSHLRRNGRGTDEGNNGNDQGRRKDNRRDGLNDRGGDRRYEEEEWPERSNRRNRDREWDKERRRYDWNSGDDYQSSNNNDNYNNRRRDDNNHDDDRRGGDRDNNRDNNREGGGRRSEWRERERERRRRRSPDRDESSDEGYEHREKRSQVVVLEGLHKTDPAALESIVTAHALKMQLSPPLKISSDMERDLAFLRFESEGNAIALINRTPLGMPLNGKIVKMSLGQLVVPPGLLRDKGEETMKLIQKARCAWSCIMCQAGNTPIAFHCTACGADRITYCPTVAGPRSTTTRAPETYGMGHMGYSTLQDNPSQRPTLRLPIPESKSFILLSAISRDPLLKHMSCPSHVTMDDSYCPRSRLYFHTADNLYSTTDGREYYRPKEDYLEPVELSKITGSAKAQILSTASGGDALGMSGRKIDLNNVLLPSSEEMKAKREGAKASVLESISQMVNANQHKVVVPPSTATVETGRKTSSSVAEAKNNATAPVLKFGTLLGSKGKLDMSSSSIKIENIEIAAAPVKIELSNPIDKEMELKALFDEEESHEEDPLENYARLPKPVESKNVLEDDLETRIKKKLETRFPVPLKITSKAEHGQFARHIGHGLCPFCLVFFSNEPDLQVHLNSSTHKNEFSYYWSKLTKGIVNELGGNKGNKTTDATR